MSYHGEKYLYNKKYNMLDEYETIQKIIPNDIQDFAIKYLIKKNMYVFSIGQNIEASDLAKVVNDF
jgi:predicted Zn-dependent peptidase